MLGPEFDRLLIGEEMGAVGTGNSDTVAILPELGCISAVARHIVRARLILWVASASCQYLYCRLGSQVSYSKNNLN